MDSNEPMNFRFFPFISTEIHLRLEIYYSDSIIKSSIKLMQLSFITLNLNSKLKPFIHSKIHCDMVHIFESVWITFRITN